MTDAIIIITIATSDILLAVTLSLYVLPSVVLSGEVVGVYLMWIEELVVLSNFDLFWFGFVVVVWDFGGTEDGNGGKLEGSIRFSGSTHLFIKKNKKKCIKNMVVQFFLRI